MADDPLVLVCSRVASLTDPVAGAITVPCSRCTQLCWLAPTSFQVMDRALVYCGECALSMIRDASHRGEPMEFGGFLPGQLDEIQRALDDDDE